MPTNNLTSAIKPLRWKEGISFGVFSVDPLGAVLIGTYGIYHPERFELSFTGMRNTDLGTFDTLEEAKYAANTHWQEVLNPYLEISNG